jgi:hypothetical protein
MKMYTIFGYKKMSAILQVIASSKPNKLHLDIQLIALKWTLCNNYLNIKANKFKLNNDAQLLNQCIILKQTLEKLGRSQFLSVFLMISVFVVCSTLPKLSVNKSI